MVEKCEKKILLSFLVMLCCHSPAWAGSKVVAVVAFEGVEIDDELFLKQVASNVSKGLLRVLDPARYQVLQVERPSTIESPPLCTNDCELEWAAAQAADYVLYGSITQIAGRFAVTLHLRRWQSLHNATRPALYG